MSISKRLNSMQRAVRSLAATGSTVTSFVAGLPIYALNGSVREARNFLFSLFGEAASALIGLELEVKGEEHLWSHRPAVFVINHQSIADVIIVAKLLRSDIVGVGKQEIRRNNPLIGRILELGGAVFIDRANARAAIESMKPLVELMQNQKISVVIAPKGTRHETATPGPFKKGAFYLAAQAGVPMVPIVIRNSRDIAQKGKFVFNPGIVEVEVLPPIDTSSWTPDSIDEQVQYVRALYTRTLGAGTG